MGEIRHLREGQRGAFVYFVDGKQLAEMVYVMYAAHRMIIEHTEVDESLKGQQIGKRLLESLVQYVREHGIKVVPYCPFAKAMLEKTKEWQDILEVRKDGAI
jgi:predicted GNAT family acetyltransferase